MPKETNSHSGPEYRTDDAGRAETWRVEELQSLKELGNKVGSTLSLAEVIRFAVREVVRMVDPDVALIQRRNGDELSVRNIYPARPRFSKVGAGVHRVGDCLCGLAAMNREPIYVADITRDPRCTLPECRAAGIHSFAALPLVHENQTMGVLGVASVARREFADQAAFLEAVAGEISISMRQAIIHEELSRRARQLEQEVRRREKAERELREINVTLEQRVAERTELAERRARQLRRLTTELTQAEQRERHRVASVLHEELQQLLNVAEWSVSLLGDKPDRPDASELIQRSEKAIAQAVQVSRSLTSELCPPVLHELGLAPAMEWLARHVQRAYGVEVDAGVDPAGEPESETTRVFLFEAARELLFNVAKHAGVAQAELIMKRDGDDVVVEVIDHGAGFDASGPDAEADPMAFGLFSIRQRADILGGKLRIETSPGKGCRAVLRNPIAAT